MIFKAYDVRGIYPREFDENIACRIVRFFVKKYGINSIALGRDVRNSSSSIMQKIIEGVNVKEIFSYGLIPTPIFYYFAKKLDAGVIITASHNPPEYNGLKFMLDGMSLTSEEVKGLSESLKVIKECGKSNAEVHVIEKSNYMTAYKDFLYSFANPVENNDELIIDYANGSVAHVKDELFKGVASINDMPDGTFPSHLPDPSKPSNLKELIDIAKRKQILGIGFDGDGDRIGVVAEDGSFVTGDKVLAVLAYYLVEKNRRKLNVITEVNVSKGVIEFLEKEGIHVDITKVGRANIEEEMHKRGYDLGGELSGHFYFNLKGEVYEDAVLAMHFLIDFLKEKNIKLKDFLEDIPSYHSTPPIRVKLKDWSMQDKIMDHVAMNYEKIFEDVEKVIDIDGIRVEMPDAWFIIRKSNTEPVIALRIEGKTKQDVDSVLKKLNTLVKSYSIVFEY